MSSVVKGDWRGNQKLPFFIYFRGMISQNEIRIGNYFKIKGELCKTHRKDFSEIHFSSSRCLARWEPIPLTPEILESCGFENGEIIGGLTRMSVKEFSTATQGVFKGEYCLTIIDAVPMRLDHRFRYMHQLQNLFFALTGQELTIKFSELV